MSETLVPGKLIANSSIRNYDSCGLAANSTLESEAGKTLYVLNVKTMVEENTKAPHATWATVMPTIGFNGCGSFGEAALARYAARPKKS